MFAWNKLCSTGSNYMDEIRIPRQLLYCILASGNHIEGRLELRYKNVIFKCHASEKLIWDGVNSIPGNLRVVQLMDISSIHMSIRVVLTLMKNIFLCPQCRHRTAAVLSK